MLFKSYVLGRPAMVCSLCRDSCCVGWVLWQLSDQDVRWRWLVCAPSRILLESLGMQWNFSNITKKISLIYNTRTKCQLHVITAIKISSYRNYKNRWKLNQLSLHHVLRWFHIFIKQYLRIFELLQIANSTLLYLLYLLYLILCRLSEIFSRFSTEFTTNLNTRAHKICCWINFLLKSASNKKWEHNINRWFMWEILGKGATWCALNQR